MGIADTPGTAGGAGGNPGIAERGRPIKIPPQ